MTDESTATLNLVNNIENTIKNLVFNEICYYGYS